VSSLAGLTCRVRPTFPSPCYWGSCLGEPLVLTFTSSPPDAFRLGVSDASALEAAGVAFQTIDRPVEVVDQRLGLVQGELERQRGDDHSSAAQLICAYSSALAI
jgi:hypothetical protein